MELRHVRYFIAVAEELNVTRAAERLGIAQPPLSQQIKALETELGTPLFRRLPHGVELTAAGAAFVDEARALVRQAEHAKLTVARVAAGQVGQLRVGMTGSAAFHPIVIESLRRFCERHPGVELALLQHDTDMLLAQLADGALDAAFVRPGALISASESILRFKDEAMVMALPSGHALARNDRVRLEQLSGATLLMFPRRAGPALHDEIIAACHRANFEPQRILEVPQITSMPSLVVAGLGIAVVPQSLSAMTFSGLAYVPIAAPAPVAPLALSFVRASALAANFVSIAASFRRKSA